MTELKCLQDDMNSCIHKVLDPIRDAIKTIQTEKGKEFAEIYQRVTGKKLKTAGGATPGAGAPADAMDTSVAASVPAPASADAASSSPPAASPSEASAATDRIKKKVEEESKREMEEAIKKQQQERGCPPRSG